MALDITAAQGATTGARYIESLRDGREVWLDGQRIDDVPSHPAFSGMVNELARIYDLQHSPEFNDVMTFESPESGNRCSVILDARPVRRRPQAEKEEQRGLDQSGVGVNWAAPPTCWRRTSSPCTKRGSG